MCGIIKIWEITRTYRRMREVISWGDACASSNMYFAFRKEDMIVAYRKDKKWTVSFLKTIKKNWRTKVRMFQIFIYFLNFRFFWSPYLLFTSPICFLTWPSWNLDIFENKWAGACRGFFSTWGGNCFFLLPRVNSLLPHLL